MLKKIIIAFLLLPTLLFAAQPVEGKDYQRIVGTELNKGKPTIEEFFSYGCPWCYHLNQPLEQWLKTQKNLDFEQVPVVFHKDWEMYAKAFYTAKALSMTDTLTPALFKAIQVDKRNLSRKQAMLDFLVQHGVDKAVAESALNNSTSVEFSLQNARRQMMRYQINGVPAFVVNGHYKTDLAMAKSPEHLFEILTYLLSKG